MDKKKIIPIIISASAFGVLATGCSPFSNKEIVFNEEKVVDIRNAKDDDTFDKYRYTYTENSEVLNKYDKLNLISCEGELNEETLDYNIALKFKNTSKTAITNLNMDFKVVSSTTAIPVKIFKFDSVESNKEFVCDISIPKDKMLQLANDDGSESETVIKNVIDSLVNSEDINLNYSYNFDSKEKFNIGHELYFDGSTYNKYMYNTMSVDDNKLKSSHVENGSYLNLVKPEDKYKNNIIETQSIQVDIDDNFNFSIKAKFKNTGTDTIDAFRFEPYILLGDTSAPDSIDRKLVSKDDIKAGEEFEVVAIYSSDVIKKALPFINKNAVNGRFYNDDDKFLRYLLQKRFASVRYTYDYETTEMAVSVSNNISRSGKLDIMSVYEYKIN